MTDENQELYKRNYPGSDSLIPGTDKVSSIPEPEQPRPAVHSADILNSRETNSKRTPTVRTYQGDIANTVKNDDVSVIKIALAEKKRQERQGNLYNTVGESKTDTKKIIKWVLIAGVIIGVVIVLGLLGYKFFKEKIAGLSSEDPNQIVTEAPVVKTETGTNTNGIQVDVRSTINVTGKNPNTIADLIKKERDKNIDLGAIRDIQFVKSSESGEQKITSTELLVALQTRVGEDLVRALYPQFTFGIYSFKPRDAFMILYVDNYPTAYSGMLAWETHMESDLKDIIVRPVLESGTVKSTDSFVDRTIQNRDCRVLFDEDGNYKLIYTFFDQKTIIVAPNERVLKEVIVRLTTGKIVR